MRYQLVKYPEIALLGERVIKGKAERDERCGIFEGWHRLGSVGVSHPFSFKGNFKC